MGPGLDGFSTGSTQNRERYFRLRNGAIIIEGHVQGLSNTRSLGEAGIPVYVVDKNRCIAAHSKYCQKFFQCPDYASDEFADFLMELAQKEHIQDWVLIPSNDHAVMTLSKHKSRLEEFYKVITPEWKVIQNIYDKSRLLKLAESAGVPIPTTHYFEDIAEVMDSELSFPVLTKGQFGLSFYKVTGKKAFLANNEAELEGQLKEIKNVLPLDETFTQELIPSDGTNKTISYTAFCINGDIKTHWAGVKLREHPLQFGTATFTKSIQAEECHGQSIPLLKALNYTGVCEVEYLLDPRSNEYKLIEINARTWLWVELAKACGVDYAKLIFDVATGNQPEFPYSYETDRYWRNPLTDSVYGMLGLLKGRYSIKDYVSSIRNPNIVNALFQKGDMKPGRVYMIYLLSFFKNR